VEDFACTAVDAAGDKHSDNNGASASRCCNVQHGFESDIDIISRSGRIGCLTD
jgi:hypothetical protein